MMKFSRIVLINVLVILALVIIGGVVAWYWTQSNNYVTSSDGVISAPSVSVAALAPGNITAVNVKVGQQVSKGQVLAQETVTNNAPATAGAKTTTPTTTTSTVDITAPTAGSVAQVSVSQGQMVGAGTPVVTEVQLGQVNVTANVSETQVHRLAVGQTVDITVDAQPGVTFHGAIQAIQPTTQSFFSLIPTAATAGTFTKVMQRVPVIISIDTAGYTLLPGESAEVRVHLNGSGS